MAAPVLDGQSDSECQFAFFLSEKKKIKQICLHCVCACMEYEI